MISASHGTVRLRRAARLCSLLVCLAAAPAVPAAARPVQPSTPASQLATSGPAPGAVPRARSTTSPEPTPGVGVWPLSPNPDVVTGFDPPTSRWGPGHRGVDLAGRVGQPVRAAQAGRVGFAGRIAGRGVVVVTHGATRTTYEPVTATVAVGDDVDAGDPIGRLELLGSHCLPRACLHWGLIRGTTYLDPLTLVGGGPVRLLPWSGLPTRIGP